MSVIETPRLRLEYLVLADAPFILQLVNEPSWLQFIGDKGVLTAGEYGGGPRLVPMSKMEEVYMPPQMLDRTPGTYNDWIAACKGGEPACSNFDIAGPFTEWIALGVVACRIPNTKLNDAPRL